MTIQSAQINYDNQEHPDFYKPSFVASDYWSEEQQSLVELSNMIGNTLVHLNNGNEEEEAIDECKRMFYVLSNVEEFFSESRCPNVKWTIENARNTIIFVGSQFDNKFQSIEDILNVKY